MEWYTTATVNIRTDPAVTSAKLGQLKQGQAVELEPTLTPVIAGGYVWRAISGGGWCAEGSTNGRFRFLGIRNGYPLTIYLPFPTLGIEAGGAVGLGIDNTIPAEVIMAWWSEKAADAVVSRAWALSLDPKLVQYTLP